MHIYTNILTHNDACTYGSDVFLLNQSGYVPGSQYSIMPLQIKPVYIHNDKYFHNS